MFMKALESLGKLTDPNFGYVKPVETVDLYFNLSKDGQLHARGPWNQEPAFKYVPDPAPQGNEPVQVHTRTTNAALPRLPSSLGTRVRQRSF
jgi:Mn-containing catalase